MKWNHNTIRFHLCFSFPFVCPINLWLINVCLSRFSFRLFFQLKVKPQPQSVLINVNKEETIKVAKSTQCRRFLFSARSHPIPTHHHRCHRQSVASTSVFRFIRNNTKASRIPLKRARWDVIRKLKRISRVVGRHWNNIRRQICHNNHLQQVIARRRPTLRRWKLGVD